MGVVGVKDRRLTGVWRLVWLVWLVAMPALGQVGGEVAAAAGDSGQPAVVAGQLSAGQAVVLGVVEGVTEFLPVSSTGHLILTSWLLGIDEQQGGKAFNIVIQLGAILAVVTLYKRRVVGMAKGCLGRDREGLRLALLLGVAFLPAAVFGLLFREAIQEWLFSPWWVAVFLALGGVGMIAVEGWYRRGRGRVPEEWSRLLQPATISFCQALTIGLFQCLALCPGMSRSMATIVGALVAGLGMVAAAEFSFLLALPTLGAATVYELLKSIDELTQGVGWTSLAVGLAVSYVVAMVCVRWLIGWLARHGLAPFGVYRLLLAAVVVWRLWRG